MYSNRQLANAIRALSMDSVQKANSGHPGSPMGMSDIATVLWRKFLKHNPNNPLWSNRDRFILSNGHSSILLYSLLHLTGYDISIDELKNFRQLGSKTPGHPEVGQTPGVEITTGPLGQGLATAVGMAIAERTLGAIFNRNNYDIINHRTWVFVGDGCLMEGISHEVCSLAGTLKLSKLIVFYDSNGISIDGRISNWFTDDTKIRFKSYNWNVISDVDGHDADSIFNAIEMSLISSDKPTIIIFRTIIGFGSPNKSNSEESHGAPLGEKEVILARNKLKWNFPPFYIPQEIYDQWNFVVQGQLLEDRWNAKFSQYKKEYPDLAFEYNRRIIKNKPDQWLNSFEKMFKKMYLNPENIATRVASQKLLECFGRVLPEIIGGSADLSPSNLSMWSLSKSIQKNLTGNYIHYGVREFGMTAISNGIAHYGGFIPYSSTFLVFTDYARSAIRMAALMKSHHIFIYTHDSIGLGEDGPTHQPIEQLASLRLTPNISVWRPCDQLETAIAWKYALERIGGPTALVLSRQNLLQIDRHVSILSNIAKGGYIILDSVEIPEIIIIATGSEVSIAITVANILIELDINVRVVSMPSTDVFDQQDRVYKEQVLPEKVICRVSIEASISDYWFKYVGLKGLIIGMDSFGESAPANQLFDKFGFNANMIVKKITSVFFSYEQKN